MNLRGGFEERINSLNGQRFHMNPGQGLLQRGQGDLRVSDKMKKRRRNLRVDN